jgi:hypothetical protein
MQEHMIDVFHIQEEHKGRDRGGLTEEATKEAREEDMGKVEEEIVVMAEEYHLPSLTMEK